MSVLSHHRADVVRIARLAAGRVFGQAPADRDPLKPLGDALERMEFGGLVGMMLGVVVEPAWLDLLTFGQFCDRVARARPCRLAA